MTPAQHQLAARLVALALLVSGGVAAWWMMSRPAVGLDAAGDASSQSVQPVLAAAGAANLTEEQKGVLDSLRLQGGSKPPPAPATPIALPPPQARSIKLLGTLVPSQGPPEGLFVDARDRLVVARPGMELPGGVRVESVSEGEATVSVNGRKLKLQTERKRAEKAAGGGA